MTMLLERARVRGRADQRSSARRVQAAMVVMGAALVASINVSVLNVALADLSRSLGATTSDLQWIVNAYTLAYASLMLAAATLGDRAGRAKMFRLGLLITIVASVGAACAPGPGALILCRALLGVGAALVTPMGLAILSVLFVEGEERARAFGAWVGVASLGLGLGPFVGGYVLEQFWWGSVFLVNVPPAVLLLILSWRYVPESSGGEHRTFDPVGMILSIAGMTLLVWVIVEGPNYGWSDGRLAVAAVLAACLLGAFVLWELRAPEPMLDVSHLRNPRISAALLAFSAVSFTFSGTLLIVGLLLRTVLGYSSMRTGAALLPFAVCVLVASTLSARLVGRIGTRWTVTVGLVSVLCSSLVLATFDTGNGYGPILAVLAALGCGFGLSSAPVTVSVMSEFPASKAGVGSAMGFTVRQVGLVLGVAGMGSLLSSGYRDGLARSVGPLRLPSGSVLRAGESVGSAYSLARRIGGDTGVRIRVAAADAFVHGIHTAALAAVGVTALGALIALRYLPDQVRSEVDDEDAPVAVASTMQ